MRCDEKGYVFNKSEERTDKIAEAMQEKGGAILEKGYVTNKREQCTEKTPEVIEGK